MIHGGVLPWARTPDGPMFLLGKERYGRWSTFGGRPEDGETILQTAVREAWEESMGFLGSKEQIETGINRYLFEMSPESIVYGLEIPYDERLPSLYKTVFDCAKQMTSKYIVYYNQKTKSHVRTRDLKSGGTKTYHVPVDTAEGFFEKIEIKWFSFDEIHAMLPEIRKQNLGTIKRLTPKIMHYYELSQHDSMAVD